MAVSRLQILSVWEFFSTRALCCGLFRTSACHVETKPVFHKAATYELDKCPSSPSDRSW